MSARLLVDLDAFARNLHVVRAAVAPATHMLVVKDDAYAHGLVPIVGRAWAEGVRWFGAFDIPTALLVRDALGSEARIFVWLLNGPDDLAAAVEADLDLGIGDRALLDELSSAVRPARVHLKIDTGLHRNGIRPEEWGSAVARAAELADDGRLRLEGVWSHIAEASDADDDAARALFDAARRDLDRAGLRAPLAHFAASAAAFARPEFRDDLVRVGAFAYGIAPAGGPDAAALGVEQIASLVAPVRATDGVHAVLGIGSQDGLPSSLAGLISVATPAGARRITRIDADRTLVEGWPTMSVGEEIRVLGAGGLHAMTDAAERIGTIGEELALRVSPLIERVYAGVRPLR